jgi:hypothetical protein
VIPRQDMTKAGGWLCSLERYKNPTGVVSVESCYCVMVWLEG